jgi:hypothetical protein
MQLIYGLEVTAEIDVVTAGEKLAAIRRLCEENMAEDANGDLTDVDSIWPSDVMAILEGRLS